MSPAVFQVANLPELGGALAAGLFAIAVLDALAAIFLDF